MTLPQASSASRLRFVADGALRFVIIVCGLIVTARALIGPLHAFSIQVNSPLNAESLLGLSLICLLLLRQRAGLNWRSNRPATIGRIQLVCYAALILLTLAAFSRSVAIYFVSDDFILLRIGHELEFGKLASLLTSPGGDGFFRPLGYIFLALCERFAGNSEVLWHSVGLTIHVLNTCLVFLFCSRLCRSLWGALFAAALFSIHGTRPEAVIWVAARVDLLATSFVLIGLLCFTACDDQRDTPFVCLAGALVCMILGILCKESAYAFPFLTTALLLADNKPSRKRIFAVMLFFIVALALFAYRWSLFGDVGGYRLPGSGSPQLLHIGILSSLKMLLFRIWAIQFFPINWSVPPSVALGLACGVAALCFLGLATARLIGPPLILPLAFIVAGAAPAIIQLGIGQDLQRSRVLYLPLTGFCLLLAWALEALPLRRVQWIVGAGILAFNLFALEHNIGVWQRVADLAKQTCRTARACITDPSKSVIVSGLPGTIDGVYFFANGFPECLKMADGFAGVVESRIVGTNPGDASANVLTWDSSQSVIRCPGGTPTSQKIPGKP